MTPDEFQRRIAELDYESSKAEASERMKIQSDLAHSALRALTVINGGALIALFTFIGNTQTKFDRELLWWSFGFFVAGLVCTVAANIGGFLAQNRFFLQTAYEAWNSQARMFGLEGKHDPERQYRVGMRYQNASIPLAVLGLIFFIAGAAFALAGVLP